MNNFTFEEIKELMQLNHPEKILSFYPGSGEEAAAKLFGITLKEYIKIKNYYRKNVLTATEELLSDNDFLEKIEKIPFSEGDTIVGFGDSITDDYQSWFEILSNVLCLVYGNDCFKFCNAGNSGDTSLNLIKRFPSVVAEKPQWIICMVGTNDVIRSGLLPTRTNISYDETCRNLDYLTELANKHTNAEWIWVTPTQIIPEKIKNLPFTKSVQNVWNTEDLRIIRNKMIEREETSVDTWSIFGNPANEKFLINDGLHPSIEGQKAIVKELISTISQLCIGAVTK